MITEAFRCGLSRPRWLVVDLSNDRGHWHCGSWPLVVCVWCAKPCWDHPGVSRARSERVLAAARERRTGRVRWGQRITIPKDDPVDRL